MDVLLDALKNFDVDAAKQGAQAFDQFLNQVFRRRRPGRDANRLGAFEPGWIERHRVVDEIARHAMLGADLAQAVRIGTVLLSAFRFSTP